MSEVACEVANDRYTGKIGGDTGGRTEVVCVRLAGLRQGRGNAAVTTVEPLPDGGAEAPVVVPASSETPVTCGFPTSPIIGLDAAIAAAPMSDGRADQAHAHEAAAEVLADRGDWRRAYQHLKAAVSLVRDERTTPDEVPDQLRIEVDRLRRERAEAREQSRRDSLTATWNRRYLDERLSTLRGDGADSPACVALADVDHFKGVNDTHGHAVGDQALVQTAKLLKSAVREVDTVARWGGDEFVILLEAMDQEHEARRVAQELLDRFGRRMQVGEHSIDLGASIGISLYPRDAFDADELIQRADEAMYLSKHREGNRYSVFGNELGNESVK
jgi:diguanylate cyclase (GGDEF)-like protein